MTQLPDRVSDFLPGAAELNLSALGKRVTAFEQFDTFPAPPGMERIILTTEEFTAICPVTEQRDFYTVTANYVPNRTRPLCLETKTYKLYLAQFANEGVFCEALASRIAHDLYEALEPDEVRVTLLQGVRGGISIKASAHLMSAELMREYRYRAHNGR